MFFLLKNVNHLLWNTFDFKMCDKQLPSLGENMKSPRISRLQLKVPNPLSSMSFTLVLLHQLSKLCLMPNLSKKRRTRYKRHHKKDSFTNEQQDAIGLLSSFHCCLLNSIRWRHVNAMFWLVEYCWWALSAESKAVDGFTHFCVILLCFPFYFFAMWSHSFLDVGLVTRS